MFLEQINRNLARKAQQMETTTAPKARKMPTPRDDGAKTVGVRVPPSMYAMLVAMKEQHKLGSIKEAVILATKIGLDVMKERGTLSAPRAE